MHFNMSTISHLEGHSWQQIVGEDVLSYKKTLSLRLQELSINRYDFMKFAKKFADFNEWYNPKLQVRLSNQLRNKEIQRQHTLEAMQRRFGTNSPMQNKDIYDKVIQTNLKKFGTKSPSSNLDVRNKQKASLEKSLGVSNPLLDASIKMKALENSRLVAEKTSAKTRATCLNKYGVQNPFLIPEVHQKAEQTILKHYGATSVFAIPEVQNKIQEDRFRRIGVRYPNQLTHEQLYERLRIQYQIEPIDYIPDLSSNSYYKVRCLVCGTEFETHINKGIPTVCPTCNQNSTRFERYVVALLREQGLEVVQHHHCLSNNREIDIYIPSKKIGFEINGAYTHNSGFNPYPDDPKSASYHRDKTLQALSKGIKLYHIWEHWNREASLSIIFAKLGIFKRRIYARKTDFRQLNSEDVAEFMSVNHIQGAFNATFTFALIYEGEIVSVIQFRRLTSSSILLSRNATLLFTEVVGGFSKLFKHALFYFKNLGYKEIVTYANRDLTPTKESVYLRHGFEFIKDTGPTMTYFVSKTIYSSSRVYPKGIYNRQNFQKQYLHKFSDFNGFVFNPNLTEQENLFNLGVYPVYNSGCFKYVLKIKD